MNYQQVLTWPLGAGLFAVAILMNRFLPATDLFNFIEGFLTGLSIVLNLRYAFNRSKRTISC
jgi:hypothetical protein